MNAKVSGFSPEIDRRRVECGRLIICDSPQLSIWINRQYLWEEACCERSVDERCVARIVVEVIGYCHKSRSVAAVPSSE